MQFVLVLITWDEYSTRPWHPDPSGGRLPATAFGNGRCYNSTVFVCNK